MLTLLILLPLLGAASLLRRSERETEGSDEKKMPDSIHIGSMTRFIRPETASRVLARLATSSPRPENVTAPNTINSSTAARLP